MHLSTAWRATAVQALVVAALSLALGLALPDSFFREWGWLAGPGAWLLCAWVTGLVLGLPLLGTLGGAAVAGLPSLVAVAGGVHWVGPAVGVVVFGAWCGYLADRRRASRPRQRSAHART